MASDMIDITLSSDEDLLISSGDFVASECTGQNQKELILNNKGDFKQDPTVGVGVFEYFDDEGSRTLVRNISIEFNKDGMDVKSISLVNGIISSDAYYP
jgi:hypothetical protein